MGERAEPLTREADEIHAFEQFIGARGRHPGHRTEHAQVSAHGTRGISGHITEQGSHFGGRAGDPVQRKATEIGDATPVVQFEHQPQGGGLAGARGAEKCRDLPGFGLEGQVLHRGRQIPAGVAGESDGLEHRFSRE